MRYRDSRRKIGEISLKITKNPLPHWRRILWWAQMDYSALRLSCTGARSLRLPAFFRPPLACSRTNPSLVRATITYHNKNLPQGEVFIMVGPDGLEPTTRPLWAACSNQLSYGPWRTQENMLKPILSQDNFFNKKTVSFHRYCFSQIR